MDETWRRLGGDLEETWMRPGELEVSERSLSIGRSLGWKPFKQRDEGLRINKFGIIKRDRDRERVYLKCF